MYSSKVLVVKYNLFTYSKNIHVIQQCCESVLSTFKILVHSYVFLGEVWSFEKKKIFDPVYWPS